MCFISLLIVLINVSDSQHNAVIKEFGSGRSQRAVKRQLNNKLEDDVVSVSTKAVVESRHTQEQAAEASGNVNG